MKKVEMLHRKGVTSYTLVYGLESLAGIGCKVLLHLLHLLSRIKNKGVKISKYSLTNGVIEKNIYPPDPSMQISVTGVTLPHF